MVGFTIPNGSSSLQDILMRPGTPYAATGAPNIASLVAGYAGSPVGHAYAYGMPQSVMSRHSGLVGGFSPFAQTHNTGSTMYPWANALTHTSVQPMSSWLQGGTQVSGGFTPGQFGIPQAGGFSPGNTGWAQTLGRYVPMHASTGYTTPSQFTGFTPNSMHLASMAGGPSLVHPGAGGYSTRGFSTLHGPAYTSGSNLPTGPYGYSSQAYSGQEENLMPFLLARRAQMFGLDPSQASGFPGLEMVTSGPRSWII